MYHEIRLRENENGWFDVLERHDPQASFRVVAKVWGNARATRVADMLRSPFADGRVPVPSGGVSGG